MLQAELKILGGKHQGKLIPLATKKFLVGREQDCHLRPNSDLVSRHHCVFSIDDYSIRLRDLGSTNGTLVNGVNLRGEVILKSGDRITIGKLELEVVIRQAAAKAPTSPIISPEFIPETAASESTVQIPGGPTEETETSYEMPVYAAPSPVVGSETADTTIIGSQVPLQYGQPAMPGYQGFPGYPPMMPPGFQMPPGYMPQSPYPQYPPGYPTPMGYPMGYPQMMPMQQGYPGSVVAAPPEPEPEAEDPNVPAVRLPKPEETGAKPATPPQATQGGAAKEEKPSNTAADIIKQYMNRRT